VRLPFKLRPLVRAGLIVAAFCCGAGTARGQNQQPAAQQPEPGSVSGRVVRTDTGEPLSHASVRLWPMDGRAEQFGAQTDQAGQFSIAQVAPGRYAIQVFREGYLTQAVSGRSGRGSLVVLIGPGESLRDLVFQMAPRAVITGRITDEDGEPLPMAQVLAMQSAFLRGKRSLQTSGTAITNDLGEYRIWGLSPGRYYIRATYSRRMQGESAASAHEEREGQQFAYAPGYYPGVPEASQAVAMELKAGQELPGLDVRLTPTKAFTVRGRVFDAVHGQPAHGCCLYINQADDIGYRTYGGAGNLDPVKGTFEVRDLVPGAYEFLGVVPAEGRQFLSRVRVEVSNADLDGVQIVVSGGANLNGRISVEGAGNVDLSSLVVNLILADRMLGMGGIRPAGVKADGTFEIPGVPEGTYEVRVVNPNHGTYVKSEQAAGQEVLETGLSVSPAGIKGGIEIVLSTKGAAIDGVVVEEDGQPVANAMVGLAPDGEKRKIYRFYQEARTDQYGKFMFRNVRPGSYKLFSWAQIGPSWQDPDVLRVVEDKGLAVSVEENGRQSVQLRVIPGGPE